MVEEIKVLHLGDVVGQPGCRALFVELKQLIKDLAADFVIANGENAADGFGITPTLANQLYGGGVDVITSGNHIWQKKEILSMLEEHDTLLRPDNYPKVVPGKGSCLVEKSGIKLAVINLQGRDHMYHIDCPFTVGKSLVKRLRKETNLILIDFHAESVKEKEALAWYLDGDVSALMGTHTHVQTADERILPHGTGYLTDLGMTGPNNSVIGVSKDIAINRSLSQMPLKMEIVDNPAVINGALITLDVKTGRTVMIERINRNSHF